MFKLSIVSPERILFEDEVQSLVVPGGEGYLGILSHHAPLISTLKVGEIKYIGRDNTEVTLATSGGFFEVSNNIATILAETVEFVSEIDLPRAESKLHQVEELLGTNLLGFELQTAKHSLSKAKNRIALCKKRNQKM